jgi:GTP-binding protein Era
MSDDYAETPPAQPSFGVVALTGRPNAGKSTLLNRVLGHKVSIVSAKPQTTRNRIVGILNEARGQIAFLDTPGVHKPLHRLNVQMMNHVRAALTEADVVALIIDVTEPFGGGDQYVIDMLRAEKEQNPDARRIVLLNKIDLLKKHKLLPLMEQYHGFGIFDDVIPISASTGVGIEALIAFLFQNMQPGEAHYSKEDYTTQPERFFASEIVREKLLHHTSDELPYTTAVNVERFEEDEETNFISIWATIYVERDSQKGIVVGRQGSMIKRIGTEARQELETILGAKVFLDLRVSVHQGWREDTRFLGELEWPLRE